MRRSPFLYTAALAGVLLLGCGERPGVTEPAPGTAPSLAATVDQFEAPWPLVFADPNTGLTIVAGATFDPQQLYDIMCVGRDFTEVADWLAVIHPTGGGGTAIHVRIKDQDQNVIVWAGAPEDICEDLVIPEVPPLAVGTARMTFTDNDFAGTTSHADAFGQGIEGTLTNPTTGQRYHLQAGFRAAALPVDRFKWVVAPYVQLAPISG